MKDARLAHLLSESAASDALIARQLESDRKSTEKQDAILAQELSRQEEMELKHKEEQQFQRLQVIIDPY